MDNNVAIKLEKDGTSPLTQALSRAGARQEALYYAHKLVLHGATINQQDIELVKEIKKKDNKLYSLIQTHIPELTEGL
ncbi:hypothetical protein [Alteromonas sp. a30]|uniref:hypothetical protein n=1 Tax=Alteromonas sp. a30 TaxID=2730917 RepID=UPI00228074F7|nr:hypothetical protein [Alteromonas sp. a30]MCY7293813.1 hypothetical protein [Alteromonas sp. a30]